MKSLRIYVATYTFRPQLDAKRETATFEIRATTQDRAEAAAAAKITDWKEISPRILSVEIFPTR